MGDTAVEREGLVAWILECKAVERGKGWTLEYRAVERERERE